MGIRMKADSASTSLSRTLWRNLSSLPSPEQVERLISRETARAERNGMQFSLCLFRVRRGGRMGVNERRLALTLLRRIRLTDEVGWFNDKYLCALLPDTAADGARIFTESVCEVVGRKGPRPATVIYTYPHDWNDDSEQEEPPRPSNGHQRRDSHAQPPAIRPGNRLTGLSEQIAQELIFPGAPGGHRNSHANAEMPPASNGHSAREALDFRHGPSSLRVHDSGVALADPIVARDATCATAGPCPLSKRHPVVPLQDLLIQRVPLWKRLIDLAGAVLLLVVFSPLLTAVALAVRLTSTGPVIFKQRRAGLGGRPFVIFKFRTMYTGAEARQAELRKFSEQDGPAFKLANDPRITPLGRILRKTSIDELPQLWNVIRGEMSLVGPRPLPIGESDGCETWQRRRLDVTPGLTCIWQIEGRSEVTFAEWVRMDVAYMRRRTLLHDLSILFRTLPAVLLRRGAR